MSRVAFVVLSFAALTGCTLLPATGPTVSQVEQLGDAGAGFDFAIVKFDARVAAILAKSRGPSLGATFGRAGYSPSIALRPGDSVAVTIYETGGSSLFGSGITVPSAAQTATPTTSAVPPTTVPPQVIENDGFVSVPFAGRVRVAGRTPQQAARDIERALTGKAIEPQVIVTPVSAGGNVATVGGEVNRAGPVPLTLRGERLLDVLAYAGGSKYQAYETYVRVTRGAHSENVLLQRIVTAPGENIMVRPGDQIFVTRYPRTFAVLGASSRVSQYTFDGDRVSLAEAVARAGGPIDTTGDPSGVYLFRFEPAKIATAVLEEHPSSTPIKITSADEFVPIAYRMDLRGPEGYFLSQGVQMRDKDVVLFTSAEGAQLLKAFTLVRGVTGIAYDLAKQAK